MTKTLTYELNYKLYEEENTSMAIDMGIDFNAAQEEADAARQPAPVGTYTLQVTDVEEGVTNDNVPRLTYKMEVVANPDPKLNGKKIMFFANTKGPGVGYLTEMLTKFKCPQAWKGTSLDERAPIGKQAKANVIISKCGKYNNVQSWV